MMQNSLKKILFYNYSNNYLIIASYIYMYNIKFSKILLREKRDSVYKTMYFYFTLYISCRSARNMCVLRSRGYT